MTIPTQLKGMRFNRVRFKEKRAFEKDWQNNPYNYDQISKYFPQENYGMICGPEVRALDDDTPDKLLINLFHENFPETMEVRDHIYFKFDNKHADKMIFEHKELTFPDSNGKETHHMGEIQGDGTYVVGPGSTHPSGAIYELKKDLPIVTISYEKFKEVFGPFFKEKKKQITRDHIATNWSGDNITDIPISSIISFNGLTDMGDGAFQGAHPKHGSDGGTNFRINLDDNNWYCFRCFPKDTKVLTPTGFKSIDKINVDDEVLGEGGQRNRVIKTFKQYFKGDFYKIESSYFEDVVATKGHEVKVARCNLCNKDYESYIACKPNCPKRKKDGKHNCPGAVIRQQLKRDKKGRFKPTKMKDELPEQLWINVEDLNPNTDFLMVPKRYNNNLTEIDGIPLNKEVGELLGWYAAEGHIHGGEKTKRNRTRTVEFTINKDEFKEAKRISFLFKKYFREEAKVYRYPDRGTHIIDCRNDKFTKLVENEIGKGSNKKKMGRLLNASRDFLKGFLRGYLSGDGHFNKQTKSWEVSSVSNNLIKEVQIAMFRTGTISRYFNSDWDMVKGCGNFIRNFLAYSTRKIQTRIFEDKDYYYLPINKISKEIKEEVVYNIETKDNTYLVPYVVHNCQSGGGPSELIAVMEGIIDCGDAGPSCYTEDQAREVIEVAREKYGLTTPEPEERDLGEVKGWAQSVSITKLAEKYNLKHCPTCGHEFNLQESHGLYYCKYCGKGGGLKKFAEMIAKKVNQKEAN